MANCTWIPSSQGISETQLVCGAVDENSANLYIGRVVHKRDLIPGKVSSDLKSIRISYDGAEHFTSDFEILLNDSNFTWVAASNGNFPRNAVIGGNTFFGENLYIARAKHHNLTIPGKVHPSHKCAYVSYDSQEYAKKDYEVLVRLGPKSAAVTDSKPEPLPEPLPKSNPESLQEPVKLISPGFKWEMYEEDEWPENAVVGGSFVDDNGQQKDLYIARAKYDENVIPGYAYKDGIFYGSFNRHEIQTECFELFVKE